MLKKQRGQGLTEFALILPVLLLLLLGIIEAGRVIWAYITVQTAAREAARYAVTGRPYLNSNAAISSQLPICRGTDPDLNPIQQGVLPWMCEPNDRKAAIKEIALNRGRTLAVNNECDLAIEYFGACADQVGAFGVFIRGQTITETVTGTEVIIVDDYPGDQGLNVEVSTFYNIRMLTPVFDAVMGGTAIRLQGRVQLQNEGLDLAIGIEPPPGIEPPDPGTETGGGTGASSAKIWSVSGYRLAQSDILRVHLENHANPGPYDVYLFDSTAPVGSQYYQICNDTSPYTGISTDASDRTDVDCSLALVPPGTYALFSTAFGTTSPSLAEAPELVEVIGSGSPQITVAGGNVWAANETTSLTLLFHDTLAPNAPYSLRLFDGAGTLVEEFATGVSGASADTVPWKPADIAGLGFTVCDLASGNTCTIRSYYSDGTTIAAETKVNINQPTIVLATDPNVYTYARGEEMRIFLRGHTPQKRYNIMITGSNGTNIIGATADTNSVGDTANPVAWSIPTACGGFATDWPNGTYSLSSHPLGQTEQIADRPNVEIFTPENPYLSVDGGYTWPAGSLINIKVLEHIPNTLHYLEFGGLPVPTSSTDNTFQTGLCGEYIIEYTIPETLAESTVDLISYLYSDSSQQASRQIKVLKKPIIQVVEGPVVLPDQEITVKLIDHTPNAGYRVELADKQLHSGIQTDGNGAAQFKYKLSTLPPPPLAYGVAHEVRSVDTTNDTVAAITNLTLRGADLVVTKVELPDQVPYNTTFPVTVTVVNTEPVAINQWVDIDLYLNPQPIGPSYLQGYNFPGDIKYWKSSIGPGEQFIITHTFKVGEYGPQPVYGYADTSAQIYEGELVGQANNPNNIGEKDFLVPCNEPEFIDNFSGSGTLPDGWSQIAYGNARGTTSTSFGSNTFSVTSEGTSTATNDDNVNGKGLFLVYRTDPVDTDGGLNVAVKVTGMDEWNDWTKAGIEIRDSLDSNSPKVAFAVIPRQNTLQLGYRHKGQSLDTAPYVSMSGFPIWLRVEREPGTGTFYYYARKTGSNPPAFTQPKSVLDAWWGAPKASINVNGMDNEVYVGLFNASYVDWSTSTTDFASFRLQACKPLAGGNDFPPGYKLCTEGLDNRSFEDRFNSAWILNQPAGGRVGGTVINSDGAVSGLNSLRGASFLSVPYTPRFYQKFIMPTWVVSDATTFELNLQHSEISTGDGSQPEDKFYVVVADQPDPATWTLLTDPVEVSNGGTTVEGLTKPVSWTPFGMSLPLAAGINLEDYASQSGVDQELYLFFYNDSNTAGSEACAAGCKTKFFFDDVSLNTCTEQKLRDPLTSRLRGRVTLNRSSGTSVVAGVKVYAYAEDDNTIYETVTLSNGEFNFYNLPTTAAGIEYTIFAIHYIVQGTQLETLAADTSTILKDGQTDDSFRAFLDLVSLEALP